MRACLELTCRTKNFQNGDSVTAVLHLHFQFVFPFFVSAFFLGLTLQKLWPLGAFLGKAALSSPQVLGITCQSVASSPSQTRSPGSENSANMAKHQGHTLDGEGDLGLHVFGVRRVWLGMKEGSNCWEFAHSL